MRGIRSIIYLAVVTIGTRTLALMPGDIVPNGKPDAVIDLATEQGAHLVDGHWRYRDVKIVETAFTAPGDDGQPSRTPNMTYDFEPHAGDAGYDDSNWAEISPLSLSTRRSTGKFCFNWYRITLTVPHRIGDFDPTNTTAVFETSLDDYAEIWVDGELSRAAGQNGGSVIAGWNATNRLVVGRNLKPGQKIQLTMFGINGPLTLVALIRRASQLRYPDRSNPRRLLACRL